MGQRNQSGAEVRAIRTTWSWSFAFWAIVAVLGVAAVGLAGWGWLQESSTDACIVAPPQTGMLDLVVRSIKVLLLSDIYYEQICNEEAMILLEIARSLGVAFSLLLAGRLVLFAVGERTSELRLRFRKKHDVVVGEGPFAEGFAQSQVLERVTHLADDRKPGGAYSRIKRNGTLRQQLHAAGARGARRILIDEGNDADTWQSAQEAASLYRNTDVFAYMSDPWALEMLLRADHDRLRPFSYAGSVARQVMLAHPPYLLARKLEASAQHILIIGFGGVGQAIAREFAITSVAANPAGMMITAVDPAMDEAGRDFKARYPALGSAIDIALIPGNVTRDDEATLAAIRERAALAKFCAVYVVIDDASLPLSNAVALRERAQRLNLFSAPIFLCSQHGAGLQDVRQGAGLVGEAKSWDRMAGIEARAMTERLVCDLKLVSFGSWAHCLDGAGLLSDNSDGPAVAIHEAYLKAYGGDALTGDTRPAARPWVQLPEQYRASNRRAAAHIRAKTDAAGFDLDGWLAKSAHGWATHELPPAAEDFKIDDPAFLARMGYLEHTRWTLDRLLEGWSLGPRDERAKTHPDLRPFSELDEKAVGKDDMIIRTTAEILPGTGKRGRKKRKAR